MLGISFNNRGLTEVPGGGGDHLAVPLSHLNKEWKWGLGQHGHECKPWNLACLLLGDMCMLDPTLNPTS